MDSKLYRLYFIVWYVLAVLLACKNIKIKYLALLKLHLFFFFKVNIVIAFIIDQFVKSWEKFTIYK